MATALDAPSRRLPGLLVMLAASACSPGGVPEFDVILRGGTLLDGGGSPGMVADVALSGDRIAAMGDLSAAGAREVLDVTGLHVAPGFIDAHSHAGSGLDTEDRSHAEPLLAQGITTVVVNPDGGGLVDLALQRAVLLEDGLGVNVAQLVPHGSVRRAVLGMEDRLPGHDELEEMKALVRAGMEEGAFGMSSGPFYAPGSYSDTDELTALARVAAEFGGVYTSHIRDESDYTIGLVAAVQEVITVARAAGLPGVVTHIKALGPPAWGKSAEVIAAIEAARAEGVEMYADQYPYEASSTGLSAALLPRWAQAGGRDSLMVRLADPATRTRIREDMQANLARRGGADRLQFRRFRPDPSIEGRTLEDVAAARSLHPLDAALELIAGGDASVVSFNMTDDDIAAFMIQPWTMTASDGALPEWQVGVPHPRAYGTFPRKLRKYVLEEKTQSLGAAVRSMTSLPADVFGVEGRGKLVPGAVADVVVFDLEEVRDLATYTDPHQLSEGMVHVFVNGAAAIRDGAFTGERAGRVLRRESR